MIAYVQQWLAQIETNHGVNPYAFAAIYAAGIIPFWLALYKIAAGVKNNNTTQIKTFSFILGIVIIAPLTYVAFFGHNLPFWFWVIAVCVVGYTVFSVIKRLKSQRTQSQHY